jgi:hypothetical protein
MKKGGMLVALAGTIVLASTALLVGGKTAPPPADETLWPTKGWAIGAIGEPATVRRSFTRARAKAGCGRNDYRHERIWALAGQNGNGSEARR